MLGVFGRGSSFRHDVTNGATPDPAAQRFSPLLNMSKLSDYPKKRGPCEDDSWNRGRALTPLFRYGDQQFDHAFPLTKGPRNWNAKVVDNRAQSLGFEAIPREHILAGHDSRDCDDGVALE